MTPEEQQIAIAEACGESDRWVIEKRGLYYRENACGYTSNLCEAWIVSEAVADTYTYDYDERVIKRRAPLKDYLNDLNACHEMENTLGKDIIRLFAFMLAQVLKTTPTVDLDDQFANIHATAAQRCEAFLKAIGKWKEVE